MLSGGNFQSSVKSVVVSAWKERWPIKKWTNMARRTLQGGSAMEMQHMAEVLFAQAFVGSSPNTVLLNYFHYSLQTSIFTYAAVLSAISRHEDLQNIASKKCILKLIDICIKDLNSGQVLEECMSLCRALLSLLKWLLRNIEQYLKGVKDVSGEDCNEIVKISCKTLQSLTQSTRTSSLMTVARFEESSVWSHIETDLAVIKNAAGQHSLQSEVSRSCHYVSQLSRLHIVRSSPIFQLSNHGNLNSVNEISINIQILLENDPNTEQDIESLAMNLLMTAKICNLPLTKLLLDVIRTCMMAHLDARNTPNEQKWVTVFYISMPQYLLAIKKNIPLIPGQGNEPHFKISEFEENLISALTTICKYDGIINAIDIGNYKLVSCFEILLKKFVEYELVQEDAVQNVKDFRLQQWNELKETESENLAGVDPNKTLKAEGTTQQLLKMLDAQLYLTKKEDFMFIFKKVCEDMNLFFSTARANGSIQDYARKLILINNVVKACPAENSSSALARSVIFDQTFFMICHITMNNGKHTITNLGWQNSSEQIPFLFSWVNKFWPEEKHLHDNMKQQKFYSLNSDQGRVEKIITVLQKGLEIDSQLKKWDDMCTNVPEALFEMVKAWQYNAVTEESITRACNTINAGLSFAMCLSCAVYLAKKASNMSRKVQTSFYIPVIHKLISKPNTDASSDESFAQRYTLYKKHCTFLVKFYLPDAFKGEGKSVLSDSDTPLVDKLITSLDKTCHEKWVGFNQLQDYHKLLKMSGSKWFCHHLITNMLSQTRKDMIHQTTNIVFGLFQMEIESLTICLLCHDIPHFLTNEDDHMMLSDPGGTALAQLTVACLAITLNRLSYQHRSDNNQAVSIKKLMLKTLVSKTINSVFLQERKESTDGNGKPHKLRRLMSSTTEHDLSNNDFSSLLGQEGDGSNFKQSSQQEPILQALNYCLDIMHSSLRERRPGPHTNFILQFINRSSHAGELVSQAVLHLMQMSMVSELTTMLASWNKIKYNASLLQDFNGIQFTLAISDLGDSKGRKIAAKSICETML